MLLAGLVVATGTNPVGAATPGPPNKYYFAEGTTRAGFATILFLLNSNAAPLQVHLVFADSTGTRTEADVTVSGQTEVGVVPRNYVGNDKDFAIEAEGSRPFSAARLMLFSHKFPNAGGVVGTTTMAGITTPLADLDIAEGSTLPGFQEYLTVLGVSTVTGTASGVDVTYGFEGKAGRTVRHGLPPSGRLTIDVNDPAEAGPGQTGVSVHIHSVDGLPIVAERPFYFSRDFAGTGRTIGGGHIAPGSLPSRQMSFAEGNVLPGWYEFLTLFNPSATDQNVSVRYLLEGAPPRTMSYPVGAGTRRTVQVYNPSEGVGRDASPALSRGVSLELTADGSGVVAERPLYAHSTIGGILINEGHDAVGIPAPATCAEFAFASTLGVDRAFLVAANPSDEVAALTVRYFNDTGPVMTKTNFADPQARTTFDLDVGASDVYGIRVESSVPLFLELPLYLDSGPEGTPIYAASVLLPTAC